MARGRQRAPSLKRRRHVREPERRFYIYCEGASTEPAYFQAIGGRYNRVQLVVSGIGGVPMTVARRAITDMRQGGFPAAGGGSSFEERDQVWAVFDRNSHPTFEQAVAKCRQAGVRTACSNPCFELWLVLHLEEYDRPATSGEVQRRLHELFPAFHHKRSPGPEFYGLLTGLESAQIRARRQLGSRQAEDRPFGNPSTTVACLTAAIHKAQKDAL